MPNDVIVWVDHLIMETDVPPYWMIELSLSAAQGAQQITHLLNRVPGACAFDISTYLVIAKLGQTYSSLEPENGRFLQPQHRKLLTRMYFWSIEHELADALRGSIAQIYYDLDYVEEGYGDWSIVEEGYSNLLTFGNLYQAWLPK